VVLRRAQEEIAKKLGTTIDVFTIGEALVEFKKGIIAEQGNKEEEFHKLSQDTPLGEESLAQAHQIIATLETAKRPWWKRLLGL